MAGQHQIRLAEPINRIERIEHLKAILEVESWPPSHDVGQMAGPVNAMDELHGLLGYFAQMVNKLVHLLLDRIHQGGDFHPAAVGIKHRRAAHPVEGRHLHRSEDIGPVQTLKNDASRAIGQLGELFQASDHANGRQLLGLTALIALQFGLTHKNQQNLAVFVPGPLHRTIRLALRHLERDGHMGHNHHFAEDHQRQASLRCWHFLAPVVVPCRQIKLGIGFISETSGVLAHGNVSLIRRGDPATRVPG